MATPLGETGLFRAMLRRSGAFESADRNPVEASDARTRLEWGGSEIALRNASSGRLLSPVRLALICTASGNRVLAIASRRYPAPRAEFITSWECESSDPADGPHEVGRGFVPLRGYLDSHLPVVEKCVSQTQALGGAHSHLPVRGFTRALLLRGVDLQEPSRGSAGATARSTRPTV